jgi:hypothetical protein
VIEQTRAKHDIYNSAYAGRASRGVPCHGGRGECLVPPFTRRIVSLLSLLFVPITAILSRLLYGQTKPSPAVVYPCNNSSVPNLRRFELLKTRCCGNPPGGP